MCRRKTRQQPRLRGQVHLLLLQPGLLGLERGRRRPDYFLGLAVQFMYSLSFIFNSRRAIFPYLLSFLRTPTRAGRYRNESQAMISDVPYLCWAPSRIVEYPPLSWIRDVYVQNKAHIGLFCDACSRKAFATIPFIHQQPVLSHWNSSAQGQTKPD